MLLLAAASSAAERKTESFANNNKGFGQFGDRIATMHGRNLLARRGVRVLAKGLQNAAELTDGDAGISGGVGRVNISASPTIITCYLGGPKPVHEVGFFTFNGDSRANQDFEVRLANNSAKPGKEPTFPKAAMLTSGEKILGANGGGFHTSFVSPDGGPLVKGKVDWVQFRIWPTYGVNAGTPAHKAGHGWTAAIELEVLGDPKDVVEPPAAQREASAALRRKARETPYVKKDTWQETMTATREAILRWEGEVDRLVFQRAGISTGCWYALNPLPAGAAEIGQIERLRKLDPTQPLVLKPAKKGAATRSLPWRKYDSIRDGELADLAGLLKAKPGQTVVLCRRVQAEGKHSRPVPAVIGLGATGGTFRLVGGHSRLTLPAPAGPVGVNEVSWRLREHLTGRCVLAVLPVTQDGRCKLWFSIQANASNPGAGEERTRTSRRLRVYDRIKRDFTDPVSRRQIGWEQWDSIWVKFVRRQMAGRTYFLSDWVPGKCTFLVEQYNRFAKERAEKIAEELANLDAPVRAKVEPYLAKFRASQPARTVAKARQRYYGVATAQEAMAEHHKIESMRLAIADQAKTFGPAYPRSGEYLRRTAKLDKRMNGVWKTIHAGRPEALGELMAAAETIASEGKAILLDNPVLRFKSLLLGRGGPGFGSNWGGPNYVGNEVVALSPVRPDGKFRTVYKGRRLTDMDLSFDAKRVLFSDNGTIHEVNVDGTGHRQITDPKDEHVHHYDACRLPSGRIVFVSTACEQAVPCTGGWHVGNLHVIDDDGTHERRLTYDQDHDWNPFVLNNGQVVFTRWEYTDTPHYFSRLLFSMNPDGTSQMEYYGSNSYWPNAMYWPRPIPGHPTRVVCIVSGHHGVSRVGQMVILDNAQGRQEADGVVQRIGDRGQRVEPVIMDGLIKEWWPRFAMPYPLTEPGSYRGAGKYFLANCKMDPSAPWSVVLVDVFDNITPLLETGYSMPIPLVPRRKPPVIPPRVDLSRSDALVYMVNVYKGGGIRGFPPGSVKALRLGSHVYRYGGNGDTRAASYEGGWDVKRILGTVPVEPDGSAYFRVPANTPIFVQPLDAEGKSLQVMRSWFTAMPGEVISCVGCHETQSTVPSVYGGKAPHRSPSDIQPWFGPTRGFGFERELQPVLDRRCVGCHDGKPGKSGQTKPDFRAKRLHKDYSGNYSPAYLALAKYVRRAGYEADYHLPAPSEWNADTSPLVQRLKKGHHNVRLTSDEWRRLYGWIDFNVPYAANWRESHRPPEDEQVARRIKYKKLYAGLDDRDEAPLADAAIAPFQAPKPAKARPAPVTLPGWPFDAAEARRMQKDTALGERTLDLGGGVNLALVPIPAGRFVMGDACGAPDEFRESVVGIERPFYLGRFEITNRQYAQFDPAHDSAYMDARFKDRFTRGYPVNEPNQPVIRVTWYEAMAFCRWLTDRTQMACTLPTEAQWEWACRAGSATPWSFGPRDKGLRNVANIADSTLSGWAWGRVEPGASDGARFSIPPGRYPPNVWGLHDMHGNVAEWTLSEYRPYPYRDGDGRNAFPARKTAIAARKVVRGGSWNDKLAACRSAWRWRYPPHQPVYNVGFRIVCTPGKLAKR